MKLCWPAGLGSKDFRFLNVLLLFKIKCLNYWPLELHFTPDHVFRSKGRSQSCLEETQLNPTPCSLEVRAYKGEWGGGNGMGWGGALKI